MQKKGAALRAVQESEVQEGEKVSPSIPDRGPGQAGSGRTEGETLPARLEFTPVPRRYRHDGWTPERQVAFIHALADTGCVDRAARMVNMAQTNCYALKRAPGAEEFRRAWDAALDCGLGRMKDIAFERALEGDVLHPPQPAIERRVPRPPELFSPRRPLQRIAIGLRHIDHPRRPVDAAGIGEGMDEGDLALGGPAVVAVAARDRSKLEAGGKRLPFRSS